MSAQAQSLADLVPDFSAEQQADLGRAFGTYSSATTVFTGRNAASSGHLTFDDSEQDIDITNIPFSYTLGEEGEMIRPKLRGAFGYFESKSSLKGFSDVYGQYESQLPAEFQGFENQPDFRKDHVLSLTGGVGLVIKPSAELKIEPAFDIIWSHAKRRFDYNNLLSAIFAEKYDRDVFNNSTESITYAPSINASYKINLGCEYSLTPSIGYTHLWTNDLWSKSRFSDFSIDSGIFQTQLTASIPLNFRVLGEKTDLRPFFKYTRLEGAVKESLLEDKLFEAGSDFAFSIEDNYFSELSVGAAYIFTDDISGYRINIGLEY